MAQRPAEAAAPGILAGAGDLPELIDVPESITATRLTLRAQRNSGVPVGTARMHRIDRTVPKSEIGYWGRTSAHGRGEAIVALARLAFDRLGAARVDSVVDEDNERAWRVCERAGFTLEGTLRHERREPGSCRLRDSRIYARINATGRSRAPAT
jgi:RimJ/RimL family protein N-acetyltransferase